MQIEMFYLFNILVILICANLIVGEPLSKDPYYGKKHPRPEPLPPIPEPLCKPVVCKEPFCTQAYEQAKTLSKLSVLDDFVEQTIYLLRDLMKSYEAELERSASSLLENLNSNAVNCPQTTEMLSHLLESKKAKSLESGLSQVLGEGMEPVHQKENDIYKNEELVDTDVKTTYSTKYSTSQREHGDSYENQLQSTGSGGKSEETQNSWKPVYNQKKEEEEDGDDSYGQQWTQNTNEKYWAEEDRRGKGITKGNGKTSGRPGQWNGKGHDHGNEKGRGHDHGQGKHSNGNKCRGVKKSESAHWVPGLDAWCQNNCPTYCPSTHCKC